VVAVVEAAVVVAAADAGATMEAMHVDLASPAGSFRNS